MKWARVTNVSINTNDGFGRIWKEVGMVCSKALSKNLPRCSMANHKLRIEFGISRKQHRRVKCKENVKLILS
jgi:hypothetical protein